jgi:hypothetical protein
MSTTAIPPIFVYESSIDKGRLSLNLTSGALRVTQTLTVQQAMDLAADLRRVADAMPRHREGGPADLGCVVL